MNKLMKRILSITTTVIASVVLVSSIIFFTMPSVVIDLANYAERVAAGLELVEVQVNKHNWVYLDGGSGETIVFLHGFGMDKDSWGTLLKDFSTSYRIIAPDLPGFGESTRLMSENYNIPIQVQRLKTFLNTVGVSSFHLVGFSMGGGIAGYYASENPSQVKSLMLIGALGAASEESDYNRLLEETGENIFLTKNVEQFDKLMTYGFYQTPSSIPEPIKTFLVDKATADYNFFEKVGKELDQEIHILDKRLPKIHAKTLIIWGANDRMIHVSSAKIFEKGINDSHTVIIDKAGHMVYFEFPEKVSKTYRIFLKNLP